METDKHIYDIHLFVCTNQRVTPKTGCGDLGSFELVAALKQELAKRNLTKKVRINKSGCLDMCEKGPAMVLYPQGKWFFYVKSEDLPTILQELKNS